MKKKQFWSRILLTLMIPALLLGSLSCQKQSHKADDAYVGFTDALGREVRVPKNPSRVAALLGSFADVWVLSGGSLCAASEDAWEDFGLERGDAVSIGGAHSPSLERLIAADPDFVLASASTASHAQMREALEQMGVAVAYFDVDSFDDYLDMLRICTAITCRADLYEQNGTSLKAQIDALKADYKSADIPERERRILLLRASSSTVKAKDSQGTVLGEMLADFGCVNIADSDTSLLENLSVEAVIRENPYRIFVVTMGNDTEAAKKSMEDLFRENPAWSTLDAVAEGRLYMMDKKLFNLKPNARWAESYEALYEKLTEK